MLQCDQLFTTDHQSMWLCDHYVQPEDRIKALAFGGAPRIRTTQKHASFSCGWQIGMVAISATSQYACATTTPANWRLWKMAPTRAVNFGFAPCRRMMTRDASGSCGMTTSRTWAVSFVSATWWRVDLCVARLEPTRIGRLWDAARKMSIAVANFGNGSRAKSHPRERVGSFAIATIPPKKKSWVRSTRIPIVVGKVSSNVQMMFATTGFGDIFWISNRLTVIVGNLHMDNLPSRAVANPVSRFGAVLTKFVASTKRRRSAATHVALAVCVSDSAYQCCSCKT